MKIQINRTQTNSAAAYGSAILLLVPLMMIGLPSTGRAGIAWQGVNGLPTVFIPPAVKPNAAPVPSFSVSTPFQAIFNSCQPICIWRIRNPGVPFFPVNQGLGLIQDTAAMLNTGPITTPSGIWGFWDPPTQIDVNQDIRVFELFTGVDTSTTSETIDWSPFDLLTSVSGYPGLSRSSFPSGNEQMPKAIALPDTISVQSDTIKGDLTGTLYGTTIVETTFENLQAELLALNPGFALDVNTLPPFVGSTGRVVLAYGDIPAGDVILFAEALPEPGSVVLVVAGLGCLAWRQRRRGR